MDWTKTIVNPTASLRDVMTSIDKAELQIALVLDSQKRLLGVITDGDIRRALLKGSSLESFAHEIMSKKPFTLSNELQPSAIYKLMREKDIHHIPILNSKGVVVNLAVHGKFLTPKRFENEVFLMVGGLGSRLGQLTKNIPKPLLKIGNKAILEIIIESFLEQGFYKFQLAVNYKAELIEAHFKDGSAWGAQITYLREPKRLGTCGALSLISKKPQLPFIVMNGDVLTKVNFQSLLEFHTKQASLATMAVRDYDIQIPFGVIDHNGSKIVDITEKPTQRYFVNAGIYVLEPDCLDFIPQATQFDMTSLFQRLLHEQKEVSSFPIQEYWLDIGRISDFQQAKLDFSEHWLNDDLSAPL